MSEQYDNKAGKLDMISALQMKQTQNKEEEPIDDGWSDYSDDEEHDNVDNQPSKGTEVKGRIPVKTENKTKKFSNLKDYLGDSGFDGQKRSNQHNKRKPQGAQGGNFYPEGVKRDRNELSKPVFTGARGGNNNNFSDEALNGIRNNNQEYTKKNYHNYNDKYSGDRDRDGERERDRRPQFHNNGKDYQSNNNRDYQNNGKDYQSNNNRDYQNNNQRSYQKPVDEKESVMKSINNFGSLVKNVNEENKNIKAPLRNYTDIDITKDNYKREQFYDNRKKEEFYENRKKEELQRPTFVNSNLEAKPTNFRELDTKGDLYLQKMQQSNLDNMVEYYSKDKEPGQRNKKREKGDPSKDNNREEIVEEGISKEMNNLNIENNEEGAYREKNDYYKQDNYKKKKRYPNYNTRHDYDVWDIVTADSNKTNLQGAEIAHEEKNYDCDYHYEHHHQEKTNYKSKRIITKKDEQEKKVEAKPVNKDKVVVSIGPAKSIRDIFG